MKAAAFEYLRADSAPQASAWLQGDERIAKVCSGSQSLGAMLNLRLVQVDRLVDVSRVPALLGCALQGERLRIGAATTHARIEDGTLPDVTRGLLPHVAGGIAYRAVRNRGTIGGSLAHADPAADWLSTLLLLGADCLLQGPGGERRLPIGEFLQGPFTTALAPDELLVAVEVPCFSTHARWSYRKLCRKPGEFAEGIGAVWVDPSHGIARAVVGALDGLPRLLQGADVLAGLQDGAALADWLAQAGVDDPYKADVLAAMLSQALGDVLAPRAAPDLAAKAYR
jgi:carbon-monoxide dehydrogenase medium subunit